MVEQERLRVCHLTSVHPHDDTRIYVKECSTLAKAGYEIHLAAPDALDEVRAGIHWHYVPKIRDNRLLRMTKTVWNVYQQALKINADIYHFHDSELIPVGLILKAKGKIVIYDVHEDVPRDILSKTWIAKPLRLRIAWLFERLENFAGRQFTALVTATPFICNRFLKLGCHAITVGNYPILAELHMPNNDWEQKERAVCYVGGIGDIRGIFEMVEAIGQTDAKLLLGGQFEDPEQREQAVAMPGWTSVQELGQLNRQEVAQALAKSMAGLVVLHPIVNYLDAIPTKMFEYMSAGIPVVTSDFRLLKKIVEDNKCGICVNPMNPKEVAEAIQWIVDHPNEAKRMGENGRRAVEEKYNWEQEATVLLKLYQELI